MNMNSSLEQRALKNAILQFCICDLNSLIKFVGWSGGSNKKELQNTAIEILRRPSDAVIAKIWKIRKSSGCVEPLCRSRPYSSATKPSSSGTVPPPANDKIQQKRRDPENDKELNSDPACELSMLTKCTRSPKHTKKIIREEFMKSHDSGIWVESISVSLLCPLGLSRLTFPCRAASCRHIQCFDGSLFLRMNAKKPKWLCPVCNRMINLGELYIDEFFTQICAQADSNCTNVVLKEDGSWIPVLERRCRKRTRAVDGRLEAGNDKRKKATEVFIDLTESTDEDEDACRKSKAGLS